MARCIFSCAGIRGMVCDNDLPVRVADELIDSLRKRERGDAISGEERVRVVFGIGERVTVTDDSLARLAGTVEQPREALNPETRVSVVVDLFGRATPVEFAL